MRRAVAQGDFVNQNALMAQQLRHVFALAPVYDGEKNIQIMHISSLHALHIDDFFLALIRQAQGRLLAALGFQPVYQAQNLNGD